MVARLKLKEIDGRAPPGVKNESHRISMLGSAPKSNRITVGGVPNMLVDLLVGNILKLRGHPQALQLPNRCSKDIGGHG